MIIDPKRVAFHSTTDVVDYVSRGPIPKPENYRLVVEKFRNPDSIGSVDSKIGKEVVISEEVVNPVTADDIAAALDRVYENRVHNRNVAIGIGAGIALITVGALFASSCNQSKTIKEEEKRK